MISQFGEDRAISILKSLLVRSKASIRVVNPDQIEVIAKATGAKNRFYHLVVWSKHQVSF